MTSNELNNQIPRMMGLVLAGGKSVRMGQDKSVIRWQGIEQRYYAADLLSNVCTHVYLSCRPEQQSGIEGYDVLPDAVTGAGPLSGILTAFGQFPTSAWMVLACDLPLIDVDTLRYLESNRDSTKIATTFESPHDGLPEPLVTIWEPASYPLLRTFYESGIFCPRKILIRNADIVKMIKPQNSAALMNANTPDDAHNIREIIARRV